MAIKLRLVTNTALSHNEVDTNFSSLFYSASQSGSSLVLHTTGSIVQAATKTAFNLGLGFGTAATGNYSHAEGINSSATGNYSHAEGESTAIGLAAHSEGQYTEATGNYSHAEGSETTSLEEASHAEGVSTLSSGFASHAEGSNTIASGVSSHAEGYATEAQGEYQHVQGQYNILSSAQSAFIHGNGTSDAARSNLIFASGSQVQITGSLKVSGSITGSLFGTASYATNGGSQTLQQVTTNGATTTNNIVSTPIVENTFGVLGIVTDNSYSDNYAGIKGVGGGYAHGVVGIGSYDSSGVYGYNEFGPGITGMSVDSIGITGTSTNGGGVTGGSTNSIGVAASSTTNTALMASTPTGNTSNIAEFRKNNVNQVSISHDGTIASNKSLINTTVDNGVDKLQVSGSTNLNGNTTITGSLSQGAAGTIASGNQSHAEGYNSSATGDFSHAEGTSAATGDFSHAEGESTAIGVIAHSEGQYTQATGNYSHAEGSETISLEEASHAEGASTLSSGFASHAEGSYTVASGVSSHAEGSNTAATGDYSHAEGSNTIASGVSSHAEGYYTVASGSYQHVQGQYNISSSVQSAFIVGNGTSDGSRSNLIFAAGSEVQITGSLMLKDILVLAPRTTTPAPSAGMIIVSGSGVDQHVYCYLNSTWKQLD